MGSEHIGPTELSKRWSVSRGTIWRWRKRTKDPLPSHLGPGGDTRFNVKEAEGWKNKPRKQS